MSGFLISLSTVMLLLSGACGSQRATPKTPWSLQFTTAGGFAGIGRGNLAVDSEGKFNYSERSAQNVRKGCESKFTSRQLQPIADAVAKSQPQQWNKPGLKVAAPDAFGYKLELRREGQTFTVEWYDNTSNQLPEDLKRLSDTLLQTMQTACKAPKPNP
jgi:hypothetical protein